MSTPLPSPINPTPDGTVVQSPADIAERVARASPESQADPHIDIPGFEIEGVLGRGGMGVVYKARQITLNRIVALKMVLGGLHAGPINHARFQIEAGAVAALQHPNVVPVYEFGWHAGLPYFSMEYVDGGSLSQRLERSVPFTFREAANVVEKLADAMASAHAKGIVHRDLKPANVLLTAHGEPKVTDFGLAKIGRSEMTPTRAVFGTPSYMAPEQAAGRTREVGTPADVYALGAILYALLTGRPPFKGQSDTETTQLVLTREPVPPRSADPRIPRDLETICLKCLEKAITKRYPTAEALAGDLRAFLGGHPITARPIGPFERAIKWIRRHPGQTGVLVATVLLAVAIAVAVDQVDRKTRKKLGEMGAESLVQTLRNANTEAVPHLLDDQYRYRALARDQLWTAVDEPVTTKLGLHARLALLSDDPRLVTEVAAYMPTARPDEILPCRQLLTPFAAAAAPPLWTVLTDQTAEPSNRVRAAAVLAGLSPEDPRWESFAPFLAHAVVRGSSAEFVVWAQALNPVGSTILPALIAEYRHSQGLLLGGRLSGSALIVEVAAYSQMADMLSWYVGDRPDELAELVVMVDPQHHRLFAPKVFANRDAVRSRLIAEISRPYRPAPAASDEISVACDAPVAAVIGAPFEQIGLFTDAAEGARAKRRANAAAALLTLGESNLVWSLLSNPKPDPTTRSYLIARLGGIGVDAEVLVRRFEWEPDPWIRRAIVIALGDYSPAVLPAPVRDAFTTRLLTLYRSDPDPGLHSAIDWLLRQKWGAGEEVASIDAALVPMSNVSPLRTGSDWFVNMEGQTYTIIRGPAEFRMGSLPGEPGRRASTESPHQKKIGREFAIATKEVTKREFEKFIKDKNLEASYNQNERYAPYLDCPAIAVTWYLAAEYCNWLSEQERIPRRQWCYEPNLKGEYGSGMRVKENYLALTGYRLPTDAEWEFACRAWSEVATYFGRAPELLPRYAWYRTNADDRSNPVGQLRPNDLGLFDTLGNVFEWTDGPGVMYVTKQLEDIGTTTYPFIIDVEGRPPREGVSRNLRGGAFLVTPSSLRSAFRLVTIPQNRVDSYGFRPARTIIRDPVVEPNP